MFLVVTSYSLVRRRPQYTVDVVIINNTTDTATTTTTFAITHIVVITMQLPVKFLNLFVMDSVVCLKSAL